MTKYVAKFEFGSNISDEEAQEWIATVQENLPEGTAATVKSVPLILDLSEVTDAHAGNKITIRGYYEHIAAGAKEKAKEQANRLVQTAHLSGVLEHVYPTGAHLDRRTLVIDGRAYDVPAYSMVELGEW